MIRKILSKAKNKFKPKTIVINHYNSYSQVGEDAIISFLFADKKIEKFTYLDVGTNIPDFSNNTYLFYLRGYKGVCVEANKTLIPLIEKVRPLDKIVFAGISTSGEKFGDFYIFNESGLNTFDKKEADFRSSLEGYEIIDKVQVPLLTINQLIQSNFDTYPDFLSLDIEGLDFDVLKSLDMERFPIPVICVESCTFSNNHIRPKDKCIIDYLLSKGYEIYADTYVNTIFVNRVWFNK